jgi:hypothetical protein
MIRKVMLVINPSPDNSNLLAMLDMVSCRLQAVNSKYENPAALQPQNRAL